MNVIAALAQTGIDSSAEVSMSLVSDFYIFPHFLSVFPFLTQGVLKILVVHMASLIMV